MSEYMRYYCDMDEAGNFSNQSAVEDAIKNGYLEECGDGYKGADGTLYRSDGTMES
ncbi:MAG: hypothetical protein IKR04_04190 [Clostridia bacterium]|nr:hypothetical protein [Clostridia bacterium]